MDALGLTADPNNPYYQPPAGSELLLRGIGSALQGVGASGSRTLQGQLIRGGAGLAGGLTSATGEAMQAKRLDPLLRQLAINQQAAQAAQGISVPVSPATAETTSAFPAATADDFYSGNGSPTLTIPGTPAVTRAPLQQAELLANARSDKDRAALMLAGNLDRFVNNPMPAAQLEHVQAQTGHLQAQSAAEVVKVIQQNAFAQAVKMHAAGIDVPRELGAFLTDDQRPQVGLPTKAILEAQMKDKLGIESSRGSLMQKTYEQAAHAQAVKQGLKPDTDEFKIAKANLFQQFLNNPESYPNIAAKTARELYLKKNPGDDAGAIKAGGDEYLRVQGQIANVRARETTAGTPLPPGTAKSISELESALRQVQNIRTNQDDSFLGPVKGREDTYGVRRQIGNYINAPIGEKEVVFRQSLADVSDMLLRARSGAQINETEFVRLRNILPKATDEPKVFKAGLDRFDKELNATIKQKMQLGTTPRGQLPQPMIAPSGIPKVLSIEKIE